MLSSVLLTAKYLLLAASISCLVSCSKNEHKRYSKPRDITLHIEMPRSVNVFEHVEPIFYDALWNHFQRAGFNLKSSSRDAFRLTSVIRRFDTGEKLVSPDVLPYNFKIRIDVECTLYDPQEKELVRKVFMFDSWASRPADVRFTSHFNYAEFKRVFERFVPRIDHYFKKYFAHEL